MRDQAVLASADFAIKIENITYTERTDGGTGMLEAISKCKTGEMSSIGMFKGFELLVEKNFLDINYLVLRGKTDYKTELSTSPVGNMVKLENLFNGIQDNIEFLEKKIAQYKGDLEASKTEYEKPFAYEEELRTKLARQGELNAMLDLENSKTCDSDIARNDSTRKESSVAESKMTYDTVERDYADAIIRSYSGKSNEISSYIFKYVDLPEEIVKQKCEDYGLCQDGIVPIIEPDLLGEYFVLRNIDKLGGFLCVADFWIKLIRDFNYLLLTKYKRGILNVARLNLAEFVTYFIQGIFEAYYMTNDMGERKRLRNLMETLFEQVYEWIPADDIMFPMGKDGTISWIAFLSQGHLNDVLNKMDYIDEGGVEKIRKTSNNPYDILISDHAREIYIEMCNCLENDMNCHKIVDLLNELAQLYEEEKQKIIELEADFRDIDIQSMKCN